MTVQEGDEPAEKPEELIAELKKCVEQLEYLIYRINVTNMQVTDDIGQPITKLLAKRDALGKHIKLLRTALERASNVNNNRYSRSEIKNVTTIDIKEQRKLVDQMSQQYRMLDMEIQTLNFKYDLVE